MVTIRPALKIKQKRLRTFLFHILLKRTVSVIPDELPYKKGDSRFTTGLCIVYTLHSSRYKDVRFTTGLFIPFTVQVTRMSDLQQDSVYISQFKLQG